jgi:hypothetical protein
MWRRPPQPRPWILLALVAALLAMSAAYVDAESSQQGNLIAALDGEISPLRLPRDHPAPASLTLTGLLRTADGGALPRVHSIELALAGRGRIDTRGLPSCPRRRIEATSTDDAVGACAGAMVGRGHLDLSVFLPNQPPFDFHANLRVFNSRRQGRRLLWLHVYGRRPPSALVLPVTFTRGDRDFPTALRIAVPAEAGPWPHLARFELTLARRFVSAGEPRSYLNASCPLPPRFSAGIFPFARASYTLANGNSIATTIVRGCRVRPSGSGQKLRPSRRSGP